MTDKKLLRILDEDRKLAMARIAELEKLIQALGPEFHVALTQSSESWHDNAPFDALRERQGALVAELVSLKSALSHALTSVPHQPKDVVGIGSVVEAKILDGNEVKRIFVAGDWTMRTGSRADWLAQPTIIVSAQSPIARAMMGRKIGDEFTFRGKYIIQSID